MEIFTYLRNLYVKFTRMQEARDTLVFDTKYLSKEKNTFKFFSKFHFKTSLVSKAKIRQISLSGPKLSERGSNEIDLELKEKKTTDREGKNRKTGRGERARKILVSRR